MRVTIQLPSHKTPRSEAAGERARDIGRETLSQHIERRLHFALNRLEDRVTSVKVRCTDVNGPKGGLDKRCALELRGPEIGVLVVEARHSDWRAAVDEGVSLASRALVRALERGSAPKTSRSHAGVTRRGAVRAALTGEVG